MRIIAGVLKGRQIQAPKTHLVRPTTDRVKETIFAIIENILSMSEASVLDLFSGGGTLGIEALSRGAQRCTFVESFYESIAVLKKNIDKLHLAERSIIIKNNVDQYITRIKDQFDIIFVDPPYAYNQYEFLAEEIYRNKLLSPAGVMMVKYSSKLILDFEPQWITRTMRSFGETEVKICQINNEGRTS